MEVKWLDIMHDCDDNLYPFVPAFLEHLNDKNWTSYRLEEITDYRLSVTDLTREEIGAEVFRFRCPPRLGGPSDGKNCDRVSRQWGGRSETG